MKKYSKVKTKGFNAEIYKGRGFYVQEKLDGSNASFTINNGELQAFSRRTKLKESNKLNGFYDWVKANFNESELTNAEITILNSHIFFGEWLVKHKVKYRDSAYKQFYLFDVYDKVAERYLNKEEVEMYANLFELKQVKTFLVVPPNEVNDYTVKGINSYVGKSVLTEDDNKGEGIVIKYLDGMSNKEECCKIVTDDFKESQRDKTIDLSANKGCIADFAITHARLDKAIFRAIDEGKLKKEDIHLKNFGIIMKEISDDFVNDVFEEEKDELLKILRKQIKNEVSYLLRSKLCSEHESN